MATKKKRSSSADCVLPPHHPLPAGELSQYSVDPDPDSENDIANYVHGQARDQTVQHVEKIKEEFVLGDKYGIWDVITRPRSLLGNHQLNESLLPKAFPKSRLHPVLRDEVERVLLASRSDGPFTVESEVLIGCGRR
jgi:hypothetical protein